MDNNQYASGPATQPKVPIIELEQVGIYSEVGEEMQGEDDTYFCTDIDGNRTLRLSPLRSNRSSCGSSLVPLSKPLFEVTEDNPTYDTSGSLIYLVVSHTGLDEKFKGEPHQAIYEATIYTPICPSSL